MGMGQQPAAAAGRPRVVVVGAGFGGLAAARALARAPVEVVVIDAKNHHTFQPLLYQVATAALSPAAIAWPIRHLLKTQANARVLMSRVTGVDPQARQVLTENGPVAYDQLVIATGATHSYFGHCEWERLAPGLKTVDASVTGTLVRMANALRLLGAEAVITGIRPALMALMNSEITPEYGDDGS